MATQKDKSWFNVRDIVTGLGFLFALWVHFEAGEKVKEIICRKLAI